MDLIHPLLLIVAGILAASSLIVAKKPDAKQLIDKLVPFQAIIGVALLAFGLFQARLLFAMFRFLSAAPLAALTGIAIIVCSILLGFMFGMPQIAKWMPGDGAAEQKGLELSRKLAPFQLMIGVIGAAAALVGLLFYFHIMGPG
jgi:hypothetical protein